MKKNILISFLFAFAIGLLVFFLKRGHFNGNSNIIILVLCVIFTVPFIKLLFPSTKEMGIGTIRFYPNLFSKVLNFFKKKSQKTN
ncbi:hypothetical protein ATE47_03355 [Chryseobacterium sp. IHB B 17019]|jgi:predicted PurR-regulated permease PerM|nr:hypothetical protein ATE47_03355 [Chryseobacterium sp. IHB B 17019]